MATYISEMLSEFLGVFFFVKVKDIKVFEFYMWHGFPITSPL